MSPSDRSGGGLGKAGHEEGFGAGQARLIDAAERAAQLAFDLRRLLERLRRLEGSPTIADTGDEETLHRVSTLLEQAADAADTSATRIAAALGAMELPWDGEDTPIAPPPTGAVPDREPRQEREPEDEFPVVELLVVARRAVRLEADVSEMLWRLRLFQLSPDAQISQGAAWALERLTPAGEAAREVAGLIEQIVEGAGRGG